MSSACSACCRRAAAAACNTSRLTSRGSADALARWSVRKRPAARGLRTLRPSRIVCSSASEQPPPPPAPLSSAATGSEDASPPRLDTTWPEVLIYSFEGGRRELSELSIDAEVRLVRQGIGSAWDLLELDEVSATSSAHADDGRLSILHNSRDDGHAAMAAMRNSGAFGAAGRRSVDLAAGKRIAGRRRRRRFGVFNTLLRSLANVASAGEEEALISSVVTRVDSLSDANARRYAYRRMLLTVLHARRSQPAMLVFRAMLQRGEADVNVCNRMLNHAGQLSRLPDIERIREIMLEAGIDTNEHSYTELLRAYSRNARERECRALLEEMRTTALDAPADSERRNVLPTVKHYNLMLRSVVLSNNLRAIEDVFDAMRREGIAPNTFTYNMIIHSLQRAERTEDAHRYFELMQRENVPPNDHTLTSMMCMYHAGGNEERFERILQLLHSRDESMSIAYCNVLLGAYGHASQPQKCDEVLAAMQQRRIRPNPRTFKVLVDLCEKAESSQEKLEDTYHRCVQAGIPVGDHSMHLMLNAALRRRNVTRAVWTLEEMRRMNIRPTRETYHTLMAHFSRAGDVASIENLYSRLTQQGFSADMVTFNTLMKTYLRAGMFSRVLGTFREMRDLRIPCSKYTFTLLFRALTLQRFDVDRDWLRLMDECGVEADELHLSQLIRGMCRANQPARAHIFLDMMIDRSMQLNGHIARPLIALHARRGDLSSARRVLAQLEVAGIPPDAEMYAALLQGYMATGDAEGALEVLEEMRVAGVARSDLVYCALVGTCATGGKYELIADVLRCLRAESRQVVGVSAFVLRDVARAARDVSTDLTPLARCAESWTVDAASAAVEARERLLHTPKDVLEARLSAMNGAVRMRADMAVVSAARDDLPQVVQLLEEARSRGHDLSYMDFLRIAAQIEGEREEDGARAERGEAGGGGGARSPRRKGRARPSLRERLSTRHSADWATLLTALDRVEFASMETEAPRNRLLTADAVAVLAAHELLRGRPERLLDSVKLGIADGFDPTSITSNIIMLAGMISADKVMLHTLGEFMVQQMHVVEAPLQEHFLDVMERLFDDYASEGGTYEDSRSLPQEQFVRSQQSAQPTLQRTS